MDSRPKFLPASLLAAAVLFVLSVEPADAQAYRWVDEDGVVHYSDRPVEGAEEIVLPEANTTTVRRYPQPQQGQQTQQARQEQRASANETVRYQTLAITSPSAEETLWNIGGQLTVEIQVTPALQQGHRMRLYFDGEGQDVSSTTVQLEEVWRGEHNLQAEILSETGTPLIRSNPLRFYVQQNTVNF